MSIARAILYLVMVPLLLVSCSSSGGGDDGGGGGGGGGPISSLTILDLAGATLTPAFSTDTLNYTATVASTVSQLTLSATSGTSSSDISLNGTSLGNGNIVQPLPLNEGPNVFTITVVADDLSSNRTYNITVTRALPPELDGISLSTGPLSPAFLPATTSYATDVGFLESNVVVTATASGSGATITINGTVVLSGQASDPIPLDEGANSLQIRVQSALGEQRDYTVAITRPVANEFLERAYSKASDTGAQDYFGSRIAIDGDTMAVSAQSWDGVFTDQGAVYVFRRIGGTWLQEGRLQASAPIQNEYFGRDLGLDGDTLAIGSNQGRALVFERTGSTWFERAVLNGSAQSGGAFGRALDLDGDTLVVGDISATVSGVSNSGGAFVFTRSGTTWTERAALSASNTVSTPAFAYGTRVVINGNTIAVSSAGDRSSIGGINSVPNQSGINYGAVYVYTGSANNWTEQAYIKPQNMSGVGAFGLAIAMDSNRLVVGSAGSPESGSNSDRAWIFRRDGTAWSEETIIAGNNTSAGDNFGINVAIQGDMIAVGAYQEQSSTSGTNPGSNNSSSASGAVYVFERGPSSWSQRVFLKASNSSADAWFGISVALSDKELAVGSSAQDSIASNSGAAYVFR
ncbi:MAG: hypothetical protein ACJAQZ_003706 [Planctomycetota bacterium]|jgi:hypothetical protein